MRRLLLAAALALAACSSDGQDPAQNGTPDAGMTGGADAAPTGTIALTSWVDQMTSMEGDEAIPDTVDDKIGIVIDTDDPAAFDSFFAE